MVSIFTIASSIRPQLLPSSTKEVSSSTSSATVTPTPFSARLRGGNALAPSAHPLADFEEFELADYIGIRERRDKDSRRQAKRAAKRRKLDEADEMKFSHSIQFNAVPDWSSHYIAYSNLKKLWVSAIPESPTMVNAADLE